MTGQPVTWGFLTCSDVPVLWRPGYSITRVRIRAARAAALSGSGALIVVGAAVLVVGVIADRAGCVLVAALGLVLGVVLAVVRYRCWVDDHPHPRGGRVFVHLGEFDALPDRVADTAEVIIESVYALHTGPARPWLDDASLRLAHQAAWDALLVLLSGHEPADQLGQVAVDLRDARALADAWADKLRGLVAADARHAAQQARSAVLGVYASVTAARDATAAGAFAWESPERNSGFGAGAQRLA